MALPTGNITAEDINQELGLAATTPITLDDKPVRILATTQGTFQEINTEPLTFPPVPLEKSNPITFEDLQARRIGHRYTAQTFDFGTLSWTDVNGQSRSVTIQQAANVFDITVCSNTTPTFPGETFTKHEQNNFLEYYVIGF